jgi:hypothetical protein
MRCSRTIKHSVRVTKTMTHNINIAASAGNHAGSMRWNLHLPFDFRNC